MTSRRRKWTSWLIAIVFVALAVWLVAHEPHPLRALANTRIDVLLLLLVFAIASQLMTSVRFGVAIEACTDRRLPQTTWVRLTSVGQFLNLLVPQLGNVYRAAALKRGHQVPYTFYAAGLFAFIWLDFLIGIVFAIVVVAAFEPGLDLARVPATFVLALVFAAALAAPFVVLLALRTGLAKRVGGRLRERAETMLSTSTRAIRQPALLLRILSLNVVLAAIQVAQLYIAFDAVGADLSVPRLMLFQVLVRVSNQIVVTPGNLGITELAYGGLAALSGLGVEYGITAAVLIRAAGTVVTVVFGVLLGGVAQLVDRRTLETD